MPFNIDDIFKIIKNSRQPIDFKLEEGEYEKIKFMPPDIQTGNLDPETKFKFVKMYSFSMEKGIYGPFYRYTPYEKKLAADNYVGGYFTNTKISCCIGCVKIKLWLYDRDRKYLYKEKEYPYKDITYLNRYECYFDIKDDKYATVFIGKVAFGRVIQIRPNNWIFGNDTERKNRICFRRSNLTDNKIVKPYCKNEQKLFFDIFENK